jgi:hypothetical protein
MGDSDLEVRTKAKADNHGAHREKQNIVSLQKCRGRKENDLVKSHRPNIVHALTSFRAW